MFQKTSFALLACFSLSLVASQEYDLKTVQKTGCLVGTPFESMVSKNDRYSCERCLDFILHTLSKGYNIGAESEADGCDLADIQMDFTAEKYGVSLLRDEHGYLRAHLYCNPHHTNSYTYFIYFDETQSDVMGVVQAKE